MALFSLKPLNPEAVEVCEGCDRVFHEAYEGQNVLSFGYRSSRTPGRIASFGRDPSNDIQLPCAGPSSQGNPNNYRGTHFFFYLAPSGELILRNLSPGLTDLEMHNVSPSEQSNYALQGSSRMRVVPRSHLDMSVVFGKRTRFRFIWRVVLFPGIQDALGQHARLLQVPGVFFTSAGHDESNVKPPLATGATYEAIIPPPSRPHEPTFSSTGTRGSGR